MALVKNNLIIQDDWAYVKDDGPLVDGKIIVSLKRWQDERETLLKRTGNLGLILQSDENPDLILQDLKFFQVIVLDFPAFTDGRSYSYARLLRERHDFEGEIRATGSVLRDQIFLMHRCGFDAFEIKADDEAALKIWLDAQSERTVFYQPTGDGRQTALSLRQRRRLAREEGEIAS